MTSSMWGPEDTQLFYTLSPDLILNSVEALGLRLTGRCLTLNSMENRVYEIEVCDFDYNDKALNSVIAKFYRPGRWSREQIQEEHDFLEDLFTRDIEVNAPIKINDQTIFEIKDHGIYFSLFEKIGGRLEVELNDDQIERLAHLLGRVHLIGKSKKAKHRLKLGPQTYGEGSIQILDKNKKIPQEHLKHYLDQVKTCLKHIRPLFEHVPVQRIHGDCHQGNVIWSYEGHPRLVDFDDMVVGPIIQDCWLLFDWNDVVKKDIFITAYEEFCEFPYGQLKLIEALRTLRMTHYNAWIAKRWDDPTFQHAFAKFHSEEYWSMQIADLRHQIMLLENQDSSIF